MSTRRYGISSEVFNSIAHEVSAANEWDIELNVREKFHIYEQPCIILSVNTIALYWKKSRLYQWIKKTGSTIREKRSHIVRRRIITKTSNGQFIKLSVVVFFLTDRRKIFRNTAQIGLWKILQLSIFALSREKCHCHGHWVRYVFFFLFFFFRFLDFLPLLGNFERCCLRIDTIFWFFSNHNPRKFRQTTLHKEGEGLAIQSGA